MLLLLITCLLVDIRNLRVTQSYVRGSAFVCFISTVHGASGPISVYVPLNNKLKKA